MPQRKRGLRRVRIRASRSGRFRCGLRTALRTAWAIPLVLHKSRRRGTALAGHGRVFCEERVSRNEQELADRLLRFEITVRRTGVLEGINAIDENIQSFVFDPSQDLHGALASLIDRLGGS